MRVQVKLKFQRLSRRAFLKESRKCFKVKSKVVLISKVTSWPAVSWAASWPWACPAGGRVGVGTWFFLLKQNFQIFGDNFLSPVERRPLV